MSSTITLDGPVVPSDADNQILKDALLHSPIDRFQSESNRYLIEVGVREGVYTSWVGSWDQSSQKVAAGTPTSILDTNRLGMRLKAGQVIVVRVTATGAPFSLRGCAVTLRLALAGGRDGRARPLVASNAQIQDSYTRTAVAALERQINTGGLAQWDESVALRDPAEIAGPALRLPAVTPVQITANQNDYNPAGLASAAVLRLSSDASRDITGLYGGSDGREILLFNVGAQDIVLKNAAAGSTAANRFDIGADITISASGSAWLWYDAVSLRWRAA
jgi:hypothetical protein